MSADPNLTEPQLFEQLRSLTTDLLWMSEADYPFFAFVWEETTIRWGLSYA